MDIEHREVIMVIIHVGLMVHGVLTVVMMHQKHRVSVLKDHLK
jgi:hypothetical protein